MHYNKFKQGFMHHKKLNANLNVFCFSETESLLNATEDLENNSQVQEQLKMMQSIQESIVDMEVC